MKNPSEPTDRPAFDADSMNPRRWMRIAAWRKRALTHEYYRSLDGAAREGISDEDYATTMATLEKMARNLGWDESQGMPGGRPGHGRWPGRGHHRGHRVHHGHHGRCRAGHEDRETVEA